jgi:hypothetical protein
MGSYVNTTSVPSTSPVAVEKTVKTMASKPEETITEQAVKLEKKGEAVAHELAVEDGTLRRRIDTDEFQPTRRIPTLDTVRVALFET